MCPEGCSGYNCNACAKTESPKESSKYVTDSTTKFLTDSAKSTSKFLTDSAISTTKFMTESPKLTTKFMTQSPKSTKCVTEKYKKQKEKPKCSPKKFVRLKNFKKRCKRVYY